MENSIKNERSSIEEDIYAKKLIKKVKEIETGLNYYIKHSQQLENELNLYKIMYENRVEEYLKLKQQIKESQKENEEKDKIIDLLIKELYIKAHISTRCYLQNSTEECMKYKNCYECLKKYFEKKVKG